MAIQAPHITGYDDNGPTLPPFRRKPLPFSERDLQGWRGKGLRRVQGFDSRRACLPEMRVPGSLRHSDPSQVQVRRLRGRSSRLRAARSSPWRKLSFVDLLAAICLFVNGAKGMSAVQFSRDLDVQYKTAFVLAHKLREACRLKPRTKPLKARSRLTALTLVAWCAPRARASATARTPLESIFSSSLA